jgi:hypothetical protein
VELDDPSTDVGPLLDLVANKRRRIILRCFEHADSYSLRALAAHIVTVEQNIDYVDVGSSERHAVYVSLYEVHLPTCAEANVLIYDTNTKTARKGPEYPTAAQLLACADNLS